MSNLPILDRKEAGLTASGLVAGYGQQTVVNGVDLRVEPGEVVAVLGPNGAGKTTLLLALAGANVVTVTAGRIHLLGRRADGPLWERAAAGMAFLPETRALIRRLTVEENLRLAGCDPDAVVTLSPELEPLMNQKGSTLSGGEQQILSLTQAIARRPRVLMADELSFGLAPLVVNRMLELARQAADDGAAVLLVEQFARQVLAIADRGYVMRRGSVITSGSAEYLAANIETIEASYLGQPPLPAEVELRAAQTKTRAVEQRRRKRMLQDKTIVVTGAASGIGAETAAELRRQGAEVIGVDRHRVEHCDVYHDVDLGDVTAVDQLLDKLPPGIDGLCNVAGLPPTAPAEAVIRVNVIAVKYLTEHLAPTMAEGGAITHLASMAGIGWPQAVEQVRQVLALGYDDDIAGFCARHRLHEEGRSYFLSKEAVQVYTMRNRWTWRERGIRVNCVSPGPVDTPILPDFIETLGDRAEEDMRIMDRPGLPDDVAPVVAFLHSDAARWFRGANLALDGGMSSHILMQIHDLDS